MSIYDVRGSRVRSVHDGWGAAGTHEAVWDGRTDEGVTVPGGVYFAEVRTHAGSDRRRVVRLH